MSKKNKKRTQSPSKKRSCVFVNSPEFEEWISCEGYTTLDKNPEILRGCSIIANLVSSMTIYLMQNTDKGDRRIKNELSRKIDINPSKYMTRKAWMNAIVMNLLLYGNGNSIVLPITENGLLEELYPVPAGWTSFIPDGLGYKVMINGIQYDPDEVLHFTYNNDRTYPWQGRGMTAEEAIAYIENCGWSTTRLGLERIRAVVREGPVQRVVDDDGGREQLVHENRRHPVGAIDRKGKV